MFLQCCSLLCNCQQMQHAVNWLSDDQMCDPCHDLPLLTLLTCAQHYDQDVINDITEAQAAAAGGAAGLVHFKGGQGILQLDQPVTLAGKPGVATRVPALQRMHNCSCHDGTEMLMNQRKLQIISIRATSES